MPSAVSDDRFLSEFAADVNAGLSKPRQKELASKYLYDSLGSKLFEAICELPEYGLTRADERVLRGCAKAIAAKLPGDVMVCELGSGDGHKTRPLLEAFSRERHIVYCPIEISGAALETCKRELADIPSVSIVGLEREYLDGLLEVAARRDDDQCLLVLFLGSTIGNFDVPASIEFLRRIRSILWPGDYLLLGADLLKPRPVLLAAYDDSLGVTAAFNCNLLARINRELSGEFLLDQFGHQAFFNERTQSIEMHLRSRVDQKIAIPGAGIEVSFAEGETIWTETSHKYSLDELRSIAAESGFSCQATWIDGEWHFADCLWTAC